jgi:hypothetical protein
VVANRALRNHRRTSSAGSIGTSRREHCPIVHAHRLCLVALAHADVAVPADSSRHTLFEAALRRALHDRSTIPDGGLLPKHILLVTAETTQLAEIVAKSELERRAKESGRDIFYLELEVEKLDGNEAQIFVGVGIAAAPKPHRIILCCCSNVDRWVRKKSRWRFVDSGMSLCG